MNFWQFLERNVFTEGFAMWSLVFMMALAAIVSTLIKCGR